MLIINNNLLLLLVIYTNQRHKINLTGVLNLRFAMEITTNSVSAKLRSDHIIRIFSHFPAKRKTKGHKNINQKHYKNKYKDTRLQWQFLWREHLVHTQRHQHRGNRGRIAQTGAVLLVRSRRRRRSGCSRLGREARQRWGRCHHETGWDRRIHRHWSDRLLVRVD